MRKTVVIICAAALILLGCCIGSVAAGSASEVTWTPNVSAAQNFGYDEVTGTYYVIANAGDIVIPFDATVQSGQFLSAVKITAMLDGSGSNLTLGGKSGWITSLNRNVIATTAGLYPVSDVQTGIVSVKITDSAGLVPGSICHLKLAVEESVGPKASSAFAEKVDDVVEVAFEVRESAVFTVAFSVDEAGNGGTLNITRITDLPAGTKLKVNGATITVTRTAHFDEREAVLVDKVIATPLVGWEFKQWQDKDTGAVISGEFALTSSMGIVAVFEKVAYQVTLSDYVYGNCTVDPVISPSLLFKTYYYSPTSNGTGTVWSRDAGNTLDAGKYFIFAQLMDGTYTPRTQFEVKKATREMPAEPLVDASSLPVIVTLADSDLEKLREDTSLKFAYRVDGVSDWILVTPEETAVGKIILSGLENGRAYTLQLKACSSANYYESAWRTVEFVTPEEAVPVYTVSYSANGGTGSPLDLLYEKGATAVIDDGSTVVRPGYVFAGWYTEPEGGEPVSGEVVISGDLNLYAHWTKKPYTIYLDGNGGEGSMQPLTGVTVDSAVTIPVSTFTKAGYGFTGWSRTPGGMVEYQDGYAGTAPKPAVDGDNLTLYAVWANVNEYSVTGDIEGEKGRDITLKLMYGNIVVASQEVKLDEETGTGSFAFTVSDGVYNLVVETADGVIMDTRLVEVNGSSRQLETIVLPCSGANSVVEVKENTPQVVAGELNTEAEANREAGMNVTVMLTVEAKEEKEITESAGAEEQKTQMAIADIKEKAGDQAENLTFIEMTVEKTVTTTEGEFVSSENLTKTNQVLELVIPYDMTGKTNITVYRYHGGAADTMRKLSSKPVDPAKYENWTYWLGDNLVYVYMDSFSEVGISYDEPGPVEYVTVKYHANNGTSSSYEDTAVKGEAYQLKTAASCGFRAPAGKVFDAWLIDGVRHAAGETLTPTADVTAYAVWKSTGGGGGGGSTPKVQKTVTEETMTVDSQKIIMIPAVDENGNTVSVPVTQLVMNDPVSGTVYVGDQTAYYNGLDIHPVTEVKAYEQRYGKSISLKNFHIDTVEEALALDIPVYGKLIGGNGNALPLVEGTSGTGDVQFYSVVEIITNVTGGCLQEIIFKVPLADLAEQGFTTSDVVMYHGITENDQRIWYPLVTTLEGTDGTSAYYKALTDGASPFGILFLKDATSVEKSAASPVNPEEPVKPVAKSPVPVLGILIALGAAAVFGLRKRR